MGFLRHIVGFTAKINFLKLYFHRENNILWIFQIEAYHLVCFILTIVNGKCILFKGGLAVAPQTMQGFPTAHRWIYGENRTFSNLIFILMFNNKSYFREEIENGVNPMAMDVTVNRVGRLILCCLARYNKNLNNHLMFQKML